MAKRRKSGIIKSSCFLICAIVILIAGCRPVLTLLPGEIRAEQTATKYPVSPVTAEQPAVSSAPTDWFTPLAVPPRKTMRPTKQHSPTVSPLLSPSETATMMPFAPLDNAWPTPPFPQPQPAELLNKPNQIVNILLLGNDVPWAQGGRTDSLIILSLNRETRKITLLSIPRDLYVVIPGWMMNRINLALPHGHGADYPGGGGALVKDTIRYNLGIPIDYYVRVGFAGFTEIVDGLGGVEIIVNCPIEDWRLQSANLDPEIEENWELFLLNPGIKQMEGDLALWYVRSRRNSNDIDRGRRQQKMVRAILQRSTSADLLANLPGLWRGFAEMFESDMKLSDALDLVLLAPELGEIEHLLLTGAALRPWTIPGSGEAVQLLNYGAAAPLLGQLMKPSALHSVNRAPIQVEVVTNDPIMYRQVADNLYWYGYHPSFVHRDIPDPPQTTIVYGGSNVKGAFAGRLASIFRLNADDIIFLNEEDVNGRGYQVSLGQGHNPCLPYLQNSWYE